MKEWICGVTEEKSREWQFVAKQELVRCRDCKNHGTIDCPMCEEASCTFYTADNWYCADGVKRE